MVATTSKEKPRARNGRLPGQRLLSSAVQQMLQLCPSPAYNCSICCTGISSICCRRTT